MAMHDMERTEPDLEPLRKSVTVRCAVDVAFEIFTRRIDSWWPKSKYSVSQERTRDCTFEPREGGQIYETRDDGERFGWGRVVAWEPPHRFVMKWHPGRDPATAQEVELRFSEGDGETRVELEHRDWAKLGHEAAKSREAYAGGWAHVLDECYVQACKKAG